MIIKAVEHGIKPDCEVSEKLNALLSSLAEADEEKTLVFEKGEYYISAEKCPEKMLYITNTIGENEFKKGETPPAHLQRVALYLENIKNLKIEGNGACFIIDGKATNAAIRDCENISVNNIEIKVVKPDIHELKVVGKGLFYVDFKIDSETQYYVENGALYFKGNGYCYNAMKKYKTAWHIAQIRKKTPEKMKRVGHLFVNAVKCKDLSNGKIRVYYTGTSKFSKDDIYYAYDVRRQYAGIFVENSKNISLCSVAQRFNYSLAFVAQNTENISLDKLDFSTGTGAVRKMASCADFIQICMCKGKTSVTNSYFDGAGDDLLNVHGMHLKIQSVNENRVVVRFMHPQSYGYNAFNVGDEIAFISPQSLAEKGRAIIKASRMINEYDIELELDNAGAARRGDAVENITMCPEVYFANNNSTRIITRGLLLTTRGRVTVESNLFKSTTMSGILLSNDAKSWYESGPCKNVTIKNNTFEYCGGTPILIYPENSVHSEYIHENITINGNAFKAYSGCCVKAKSSRGITLSGNTYANKNHISTTNCADIYEK